MKKYSTQDYIKEKILKAKRQYVSHHTNEEYTRLKREIVTQSILRAKANLEDYDRFIERVKDETYFDISHIHELGLPYNILIFLAKKGIGKSYWMVKYINEIVDDGGSVVIIRTTDEDRKCGLDLHLKSYDAHFEMDGKGNLLHKTQTVEETYYKVNPKTGLEEEKKRLVPRHCGVAMSLTTALKWKGGGYPGVRAIIYDEASDERKGVTAEHFTHFMVSMANSIEREKNIPMIILGNTDFNSSHPLFESFQIDPDENLVYIDRQPEGAKVNTKILYINSRGLYKAGAAFSHFIGSGGDVHRAMSAFLNEASVLSNKVLALDMTVMGDPYLCLVFMDKGERYHVKVASYENKTERYDDDDPETWYFVQVDKFNPVYTHGYEVLSSDLVTCNLFDYTVQYREDLSSEWADLHWIISSNNVFFIGWDSATMVEKQINKNLEKDEYYWT